MDTVAQSGAGEIAEDIEQILAAEGDGVFDLSPFTERWLLDALDRLTSGQPVVDSTP